MKDTIYRADAIEEWDKLSKRGRIEFDQVLMTLPSAKPTPEEVWSVAQKVFYSTLTYREAVDYLKEVEKQHERFNQQSRCD